MSKSTSFYSTRKLRFSKAQPSPNQVFTNVPLTNMSVAFIQSDSNFIARRVFPNIGTPLQGGMFWIYPQGTYTRDEMKARAPGAPAAMMGHKPTSDTYLTEFYTIGHPLPDQTIANNQNPLNSRRAAMRIITRAAQTRLERYFATNFVKASLWTGIADKTGVSGTPTTNQFRQWDQSSSTPIKDVIAWKQELHQNADGLDANGLLIGRQVYDALQTHPEFLDRVNRGQTNGPATVDTTLLAQLFGVREVVVANAVYNSANEGATVANSFIVGKQALLYYVTDAPAIEEASAGYTFNWTNMLGGGGSEIGTRIREYRSNETLSDILECDMAFAQKAVCTQMGGYAASVVA